MSSESEYSSSSGSEDEEFTPKPKRTPAKRKTPAKKKASASSKKTKKSITDTEHSKSDDDDTELNVDENKKKTSPKRGASSKKTPKVACKKKKEEEPTEILDLSEPPKKDDLIPEFICKLGGDYIVKLIQFSSYGVPYVQVQKVDEKMTKLYGVSMPIDIAQKLEEALIETFKHFNKNKKNK